MREFVALVAALMASNALAIDAMLPALPAIGDSLHVAQANHRQLVITVYLIGFGIAQLIYGPLSDRFGRKGLLVVGLGLYVVFATVAGLAASFPLLLAARTMQGVAAASTRVLVMAIVRDRYQGSAMARIMSLAMIVFMIVPILAPSFGQGVLAISSWRHIFIGLAVYGLILTLWVILRLPETLAPAARRALSFASIGQATKETLGNRASIGNTITVTLVMGGLFSFITSIQQIVFDVFGRPDLIGLVFACIAGPMALSSYANSRLVHRFGPRRLLLTALAGFSVAALIHLVVTETMGETIWAFVLMQALTMSSFGLIGSNAGALAMEPLGHIAGTASSLQGVITTVGGALIGYAIGQNFNGTTLPFLIGFSSCAILALLIAYWANPAMIKPPGQGPSHIKTE
ncbi:multidrug effflux MFS transporter [Sphingosinicella rhizophila]|uniref:Bcr/CflA family efflux transporter n=1 Tax=Sphingosinicella rhizophila TaxID=3050082 RepID=A0ABU3Q313_9SPHN|nr:multidrug effflux MFS transporter [Sphingosinicella sp. GR2756]MDT9597702.1 multidrug effflux MFS transporter [Sphingosinicella sp. GR2756]